VIARLSDFIRSRQADILREWERGVRALPKAAGLSEPRLVDHVPALLGQIADLADALAAGAEPPIPGELPEKHAHQRLDEGFDLMEVVAEYAVLRDCITQLWSTAAPAGQLDPVGLRALHRAIDRAIGASVHHFTYARDLTLQSLDRISAAALEARSVEELLERLLRVLLETTSAVDTATIMLRQDDRLVVRASVGLEDEVKNQFAVRIGEGFAGTIAETRRPLGLKAAATDPLLLSPWLRARGVKGLYGVPLLDGEEVIGVAQIGSCTAQEFSQQDKRLLATLASRATTAIVQHLLRHAAELRTRELDLALEQRKQFETIVELHPDMMYLLDRELRFTYANPALLSFWGRSRADVFGRTLDELNYPEEFLELHRREMNQVLAGKTVKGENADKTPDGTERFFEYVMVPVIGPDGTPRAIAGANRDITERKRIELDRAHFLATERAARQQAEEALAAVDALFSNAVIGLGFLDRELRYVRINETLAAMNGRSAAEHLGRTVREMIGEHAAQIEPVLRSVLDTGKAAPNLLLAIEPPGAPQHKRAFLANYFPVRLAGGETFGIGAAVIEITDRVRAEDALQESLKAREEILAIVSHDLKNPLASVHISASVLALHPARDPAVLKQVERILRATMRMDRLIDDLLDMANIQAGRLSVKRSSENADALMVEAIESQEPAAREKGVRIALALELDGAQLFCDRERILQVFGNLLGNAIKFCQAGNVITVRGRIEAPNVRFDVIDNGPGISEDELPHIFEPYWSARRHDKKGTGLGLYIARGIVEVHGGRIWAESRLGEGATFSFTLPLEVPAPEKTR
jgi:PAS domain S-box-containing protein